jgi:hypothetical protein
VGYQQSPYDRRDTAARQQPPGWYPDPSSYLDPAGRHVLRWWNGARWSDQTRLLAGPQSGRPGRPPREPWPPGLKVLAALGSLSVLILVTVGFASLNSRPADDVSAVATTPARTATPSRTPTHHAVTAKAVPAKAPVTGQAAAPGPPPAAPAPATSTPAPAKTTPAATPSRPAATTPAGCHPLSNEGTCYEPGEYCRHADHGLSGMAGDGKPITCEDKDGWRWEPA